MKRSLVVGMMVLVFLFAGSAFGAEPIKLGMSTWLGYAPLYLAKEKGFFKKQGVDVEVVVIESPADRRAAFAADKIQGMATTVDTHVMTAAAENPIPVKQVLALDDSHGGDGIVAKKEIKTQTASDLGLKGEEVGLQGSDIRVDQIFFPPAGEGAEWLEGKPEEVALKVLDILKDKGGLA